MNAPAVIPATLLPRGYYVDPDVFREEIERVFFRQWTLLGHVSDIPKAGDFFRQDLFGESVIVVRQADGRIAGLLNVCRHRGHAVCGTERGNAKSFVCPYHQWTYDLDGRLKRAPGFKDGSGIRYADYGLKPVQTGIWNGFIFGWLAAEPARPIRDCFAFEGHPVDRLAPERIKEIHRESYLINANWKVLLENYLECYHCHGSHPELCATMDVEATYRNTEGDWKGEYFTGPVQLKPGSVTASMTGALVSLPLGEFRGVKDLPDGYGGGIGVLPLLSRVIFHIDHAIAHVMRPIDVGRVRWETRWYVAEDAIEGRDYEKARVTEVWSRTNAEDIALCENAYRGISSRHYEPGPLHPQREGAIRPTLDTYLELMGR